MTREKDIIDNPERTVESRETLDSRISPAANNSSTASGDIRYDNKSSIVADLTSHDMAETFQAQENPLGATNQTATHDILPAMPPIQGDIGMEVDSAVSMPIMSRTRLKLTQMQSSEADGDTDSTMGADIQYVQQAMLLRIFID
jgi:hypothetical protein